MPSTPARLPVPTRANSRAVAGGAAVRLVRLLADLHDVPLPAAAGRLAAAGVLVFPCRAGQKRPSTVHGLLDASTDPAQVAAWWRRWPSANIGLPTGALSGVVVLDVDVRPAGSGQPAFRDLVRRGLADRWAGLVRTPSGGLHAYYPADPGRPGRCWQAGDRHIDFRGDGGYVIAPPSVITQPDGMGRSYTVTQITSVPPRFLDAGAVRDLLIPHPAPASPTRLDAVRAGADRDRLAAWVAAQGEGQRNRGLFWAACRLAETGTPAAEIHTLLAPAAEHAGLPAEEIASTIRSAARTAGPRPAADPPSPGSRPGRPVIRGPDLGRQ